MNNKNATKPFDAKQIAKKIVKQIEREKSNFDRTYTLTMYLEDLQDEKGYTDEQIKDIRKECEHIFLWG